MQNRYLSDIIEFDPLSDLEHHGVLGMKWGIRRYQPYSLIPRKSGKSGKVVGAAKKRGKSGKTSVSSKSSNKKVAEIKKSRNQKSAEAKEAVEKQAKTARQRQQELEKVVNSGDAKLVYEHRHELTKKQLDSAIDRINTEARVASLVRQQNPTKLDKLKQFAGKVDDANTIAKSAVNTYKTVSDIKKLYDDASKARTAKEKADASAKVLKEIIDAGNTAKDIKSLQSKLSKEDLATATQRLTNLSTLDKNEYEMQKRSRQEYNDNEKYRRDRSKYLDKSLKDLRRGQETADHWAYDFVPTSENDAYDSYVNNQVEKKKKKRK